MRIFQIFLIIGFICGLSSASEILDEMKKCKFGPDFDECFRVALNTILSKLGDGDKELGLIPLEPITIPYMAFEQKSSGSVQMKQEYRNNQLHNFTSSTYKKVHFDLQKGTLTVEAFSPKLVMEGTYDINGKILQLPIKGGGPYTLEIDNLVIKYTMQFEKIERDGEIYWNFLRSSGHFYPDGITLHADNIVDGQKEVSEQIVAVINENWRDLYRELERPFAAVMSKVITGLFNKTIAKFAISKVFGRY